MTIIEQIKTEIERRQKENFNQQGSFAAGRVVEDADILSFISTLESEKPMNQDGLEEEYKDYVESDPVYSKLVNGIAGLSIARHFTQWGAEHAKEELMQDALHGWLDEDNEPPYDLNVLCEEKIPFGEFKHGDKVRIIIVKED